MTTCADAGTAATGARPSWFQLWRYSWRIRRPEFLLAELPMFLLPAVILADSPSHLISNTNLIAALVGIVLIFHMMDMINCLADRDLDAAFKSRLSKAVYALGATNIRWQMAISTIVGFGILTYLAKVTGHWDIVPLALLNIFFGAQYSVKPLFLKSAGLWQILAEWGILFGLPMTIVARMFPLTPGWELFLMIVMFGMIQQGIILVNIAEDVPDDRKFGLRTAAIALGYPRVFVVAVAMVAVGGIGFLTALLMFGLPLWGTLLFLAAWGWVVVHITGTLTRVRGKEFDAALAIVRTRSPLVAVQLTLTAWSGLATVVITALSR